MGELERTRIRLAGSAEAGMIELPDVSVLPALGLLAAAGLLGTAALRRLAPFLDLLEQIAYGIPVGVVVVSLGTLLLASALGLGLSTGLVVVIGLTSAIGASVLGSDAPWRVRLGLWPWRGSRSGARRSVSSLVHPLRSQTGFLPALVISLLALRWAIFWSGAFRYDSEGLWAGHLDLWGDWALHLGNTSSFAYGRNFPPELPQLAGYSHTYHYLASLTAAMMVTAGMDPAFALCLHSFLLSVVLALCIYALARRLTECSETATLAVVLFFLTGSPFFLPDLEPVSWRNVYFTLLVPQRAFLYGLPLLMLVLALLFRAIQGHLSRPFLLAGLVAGLLPLAHLGALLTLALLTPFLYLLFPSKRWLVFLGAWLGLAGPQLLFQFHDAPAMASSLRLQPGWIATPTRGVALVLARQSGVFASTRRLGAGAARDSAATSAPVSWGLGAGLRDSQSGGLSAVGLG